MRVSVANLALFPRLWACFLYFAGVFYKLRVAFFWGLFSGKTLRIIWKRNNFLSKCKMYFLLTVFIFSQMFGCWSKHNC